MKRQRHSEGAIVKIVFDENTHTYGRLLFKPYVAVYDFKTNEEHTDMEEIVSKPVLFTICVFDFAVNKGRWEIIGKIPLSKNNIEIPLQFMQEIQPPYQCSVIDAYGNSKPASLEQCRGLEKSAVWDPEHVEERIRDHYAGRKNKWLESLKLKEQ